MQPAYQDAHSYFDPALCPGLTNANTPLITWRTTWALAEPTQGNYDFDYLDACVAAAAANGKDYGMQILAGHRRPDWFIDLIADTDELFNTADGLQIPVPWGPIFQTRWQAFLSEVATRYKDDSRFKYIKMAGVGRASESNFANTVADKAIVDAMARAVRYADAPSAWLAGGQANTDFYAPAFDPVPVVLVTGNPFLGQIGVDTLTKLVNCGNTPRPRSGSCSSRRCCPRRSPSRCT